MQSVGVHLNRRTNRQCRGKALSYKTAGESQACGKDCSKAGENEKKLKQRFFE